MVGRLEAEMIPATPGFRFCLWHCPGEGAVARGGIVFAPPFAEESNCARRAASLQARAFAEAGFVVLQIDLHGCGDSSGDFADACWSSWVEDLALAARLLRQRVTGPLWFWGLRSGCLLAAEAAGRLEDSVNLLFWQPVASGEQALRQFLRLGVAGEMLAGEGKASGAGLMQRLAQGQTVEVAGYGVSAGLAQGMAAAKLAIPINVGRVEVVEVTRRDDPTPSPAMSIEGAHRFGVRVVKGAAFWSLNQSPDNDELIAASLDAVTDAVP